MRIFTYVAVAMSIGVGVTPAIAQEQKRIAVVQSLYNYLLYPNFLPYVQGAVQPDFFDAAVRGRIAPLGEAQDLPSVMNLLLTLTSGQPPQPAATAVRFKSIVASRDRVAVEVDIEVSNPDPSAPRSKLRHVGVFTFNDKNKIVSFDLSIPYLGMFDQTSLAMQQAVIASVCQRHGQTCQGPNQQFSSTQECVSFLSSIAFGSWNRVNSNSVVCRQFYSTLGVTTAPDVYCPAVGPTGGGRCVDVPYGSYFVTDF